MSWPFLIALAWKSAFCAGLTLGTLRLFRSRSAAERSRLAHAGLVATLLLPAASLTLPPIEFQAPASIAPVVAAPRPASIDAPLAPFAPVAAASSVEAGQAASPMLPPAALLGLPGALLLVMTLIATLRLRRLRSRARMLEDPHWLLALAAAQQRSGFKQGTALLVSDELSSPISWGVLRPTILLDVQAAADTRQAEAIIAHELAHVARLDWAKLLIGRAACALFWFNPLVWMLAARCHELREEAADDAVLRSHVGHADYAELLLGVARHENRALLLAANGVAPSRGSLKRRVKRVLDRSCRRAPARLAWTFACLMGATAFALPVAAVSLTGQSGAAAGLPFAAPLPSTNDSHGASPVVTVRSANSAASVPVKSGGEEEIRQDQTAPEAPVRLLPASRINSPLLAEALIHAARVGDLETIRELLALGVSPNAIYPGDGTALIAAARAGRRDAAELLLSRGAAIDLGVPGDANPLIAAARGGQRDMADFLLSRGASINAAVPGEGTPLIAAASAGQKDMVRLLLDRGASIEKIVPGEENALITASRTGRDDVVELLIGRGADVNSRAFGRTPLGMARAGGHRRIESMLTAAGALP